ncbi:hypothetical protein ACHAXR_005133 [Thalassiosira sp. AJA248-18]
MSNNLYPSLNSKQPTGSFDDYDSIIDEFSIGYNTKGGDSDDVSSMHMSEMGGASVNAAGGSPPRKGTAARGRTAAQKPPGVVVRATSDHAVVAPNATTGAGVHLLADGGGSPQRSIASNSTSFKLSSDADGYYHVGDLGIDTTDVSAILGVASSDPLDGQSLLVKEEELELDQHSLPPPGEVKHNSVFRDVEDQRETNKQLGPLGDELSYAGDANDNNQIYDGDDYSDDDDESQENEGLLPNWIAFSSQRAKVIFVASSALVLGSLVLAVVALGISYGTVGGGGNDGSASEIDRAEEAPSNVVPVVTFVPEPTKYPTVSPMIDLLETASSAPVLSTTGEESSPSTPSPQTAITTTTVTVSPTTSVPTTSSPVTASPTTLEPTVTQTMTSTLSPTSSPSIPLETAAIEETATTTDPTSSPTTQTSARPSIISSRSSNQPSELSSLRPSENTSAIPSRTPSTKPSGNPTLTLAPTNSALPTNHPSISPTHSFSPTSQPSFNPTESPSLVPSLSSKPSWSFGDDAIDEGDAIFYLMADGGSNWKFWTEKFQGLPVEQHKFLVHLGSATRVVDNCATTAYYRTQLSLSVSPVPVYSIPGNNDYPECADPTEGWANYQEHMMDINTMYWNATDDYDLKRQVNRTENFSFLHKRVLFVGLNMVTNSNANETSVRLEDNIDWVETNVEAYWDNINAIFIMGYGRLLADENEPFYSAMIAKKESVWKDKLLVYARRASESELDKDVTGIKGFVELKVGNEWPIMDVRVRTKGVAKVEYRLVEDEEKGGGGGGKDGRA